MITITGAATCLGILYELVSLVKAFQSDNLPALVNKIMAREYPPPPESTPPAVINLLDRMLSLDPKDRPTATQILGDPVLREPNSPTEGASEPELGDDADAECLSHVYYWAASAVVPRQYVFEESLRIEAVAIGRAHCCAMSATGLAFTWGDNRHGQLGHGDFVLRTEPQVVTSLLSKGAARVACGGNVTAVVSFNGLLQMCGEAAHGGLGSGDTTPDRPTPQLVQVSDDCAVLCRLSHTCDFLIVLLCVL